MHHHPDAVVIYLTDVHVKMTLPDGTSVVQDGKAGESVFTPAGNHLPENMTDKPMDAILVELRGPAPKPPVKKPTT